MRIAPVKKRTRITGEKYHSERGSRRHLFRIVPFLFFLAALFPGCLEKIDVQAPKDLLSAIVIQGHLAKGNPSLLRVEVSALFNFSGASRRLINVREVLLLDESGSSLSIPAVGLGVHALEIPEDHPSFRIETGKTYRLRVATRDGRTYESAPEPILPVPSARRLTAEVVDKEVLNREGEIVLAQYIRFFIDTPLITAEGGKKARLKWDALKTYRASDLMDNTCYLTEVADVTNLWLQDGNLIAGEEIEKIPVHEEAIGSRFGEGFYLTVLQQSLSTKAFQYWDEVNQLIERTGSIFEPPAGKLKSNFININDPEEEAFGFFYATTQDTVRLYISPEFAGNPPSVCPPAGNLYSQSGDCIYPVCCDCRDVPNGTESKPDFWVE